MFFIYSYAFYVCYFLGICFSRYVLNITSKRVLSVSVIDFIVIFASLQYLLLFLGSLLTKDDVVLSYGFYNTVFIYFDFNPSNCLVAFGCALMQFSANLYSILYRYKKSDIALGNLNALVAYFGIFAENFHSLFFALEIMSCISFLIIFSYKGRIHNASQYFYNHILGSFFILVGIIYFVEYLHIDKLVLLTDLFDHSNYSKFIIGLMIIGFLIYMGSFPFSGYLIDAYSCVSHNIFLYMFFPSTVVVYSFYKLFLGFEIVSIFFIVTILYLSWKILFIKKDLLKVLTTYCVIQYFVVLLFISGGNVYGNGMRYILMYFFLSIVYKLLLNLSSILLMDVPDGKCRFYFMRIVVLISLLFALINMISFPFLAGFYFKAFVLGDTFYEYVVLFANLCISISFFREIFSGSFRVSKSLTSHSAMGQLNLKFTHFFNIFVVIFFLGITSYIWSVEENFFEIKLSYIQLLKPVIILFIGWGVLRYDIFTLKNTHIFSISTWIMKVFEGKNFSLKELKFINFILAVGNLFEKEKICNKMRTFTKNFNTQGRSIEIVVCILCLCLFFIR